MPHLILEYSNNLKKQDQFDNLFAKIHGLLANELPTDIASCKSRALGYDDFYLGTGQPDQAFVHVTIKIMSGRAPDKLREVGNHVMQILRDHFSQCMSGGQVQISLEIMELTETYFK